MRNLFLIPFLLIGPGSNLLGFSVDKQESGNSNRTSYIQMSKKIDESKPLAVSDYSGFVSREKEIFGSVGPRWAVRYNFDTKTPISWYKIDSELSIPALVSANDVFFATRSGGLYKYEISTGKLAWKISLQTYASKKMIVNAGKLFTVDGSGNVVAIDYQTGQKSWLVSLSNVSEMDVRDVSSIVVNGPNLYVGSRKTVEVFKVKNGSKVGEYSVPAIEGKFGSVIGDISFAADTIVFARYDGYIFSFNTGKFSSLRWKQRVDSEVTSMNSEGGVLHIGTSKGKFHLMDIKTGKNIWSASFGEPISGSYIGLKNIFVSSTKGLVAKLKRNNGEIEWVDHLNARLLSKPFAYDRQIFYSTGLKNIYGFSL